MLLPGESLCKQTSHFVVETLNSHLQLHTSPGSWIYRKKRHSNVLNLAFGLSNWIKLLVNTLNYWFGWESKNLSALALWLCPSSKPLVLQRPKIIKTSPFFFKEYGWLDMHRIRQCLLLYLLKCESLSKHQPYRRWRPEVQMYSFICFRFVNISKKDAQVCEILFFGLPNCLPIQVTFVCRIV